MKWRLIIDSHARIAAENMAIDSALQKLCNVPVLRFYTWNPPAISIGRFQSLKDEIDIDYAKKNKIDFVRRVTGGGAVFHENEITYSVSIKEENLFFPSDLHESYKEICQCIIAGLSQFGLKAEYIPINDIILNGKKISGCAQTRKNNVILQHGTLLIEVDVEKMFSVLKVPDEKIKDKLIASVKDRVTCINSELKRKVSQTELINAIVNGFEKHLKIEFEQSELSEEELEMMKDIKKNVFENEKWIFER